MNIVEPLKGEFCPGHFGRIRLLNFFENSSETIYELERQFGQKVSPRKNVAVFHLIANHCGLTVEDYAIEHSLLPFSNFFVEYASEVKWQTWKYGLLRQHGLGQIRKNAYFCQECVQEDIGQRKFSYWRTMHQIPGNNWCWIHRCLLNFTKDTEAFEISPSHLMIGSSQCSPEHGFTLDDAQIAIQLFVEICVKIASTKNIARLTSLKSRLKIEYIALDVRRLSAGDSRNLDELILANFPIQWLQEFSPEARPKFQRYSFSHSEKSIGRWAESTLSEVITVAAVLISNRRTESPTWLLGDQNCPSAV